MSDLLKESIADAKAVRETAIANAKTFLEENFAKSMKEMFAEKLKEEAEMDEATEGDQGSATPEGGAKAIGTSSVGTSHDLMNPKPVKPSTDASKTTTEDPAGPGPDVVKLEGAEAASDESSDEITSEELDEILAELEKEATPADPVAEESDPVAEQQVAEAKKEEEEEEAEEKKKQEEAVNEEVNLDELLSELEGEEASAAPSEPAAEQPVAEVGEEEQHEVTAEEMAEALVAINEENESLKTKLAEHENTVKYLKGVLEETNLLNAKLLYTNKLFKGKNLTEEQKLKVINTFDLTKTIREIKLAYTVLAESINAGGSVAKKKSNATVATITEGLASKPVSSTKPEPTIVEPQADEMTSRFQKLAGIKR
jgi:hypothetical protein